MTRSETRAQKRKEVVEAIILRNEPATLVARVYNTSTRNVFNWLARYRNGGWQALEDKSKQGRPRKVTGEDMKWLYCAITMENPMNYQFSFCLWTLNTIRGLLEQERNIKLSKSSVGRLLNHLGLSPQKPLYKSYKQDPQKIKDYLTQTYPDAVAEATKHKARLYFIDEAAFRSDAHRGTTWGKVGETPIIKDTGGRFGFKLISAVSARGEMHFEVIDGRMNSEKFIAYLEQLRSDTGHPIFIIADNARYHHSKVVQAFLKERQGDIMMAFLPAYSPELNPDEQVWNHAKAEVGKKSAIRNKDDMARIILSAMKTIQKKTDLVKSFFKLTDTIYAQEGS
jgi:transposase